VDRYIMEKEYASLPKNCLIEALYTNQGVVLDLVLKPHALRKVDSVRVAFDEIEIRSSGARGFKVTGYPVEAVVLVERGTAQSDEPEAMPEESAEAPAGTADAATAPAAGAEAGSATAPQTAPAAEAAPTATAPAPAPTSTPAAPREVDATTPPKSAPPPAGQDVAPGSRTEPTHDVGREWERRTRSATRGLEQAHGETAAPPLAPAAVPERPGKGKARQPSPAPAETPPEPVRPPKSAKDKPATAKTEPPAPPAKSRHPATPAPPRDPRRKIIDEETPFFLE